MRMDFESVQEVADSLAQASTACAEAAAESQRNRSEVVSSVERIAFSQRRVDVFIAAMRDNLDIAEHKAATAVWDGDSYERFFTEVERHRRVLQRVEVQYKEAYDEAINSFDRLRRRVVQLDEGFNNSCGTAGASLEKMAYLARRHADEMRDLVDKDFRM